MTEKNSVGCSPKGAPQSWRDVRGFYAEDAAVNKERISRITVGLLRTGQWLERDRRMGTAAQRKAWRVVYALWSSIVGFEIPPLIEVGPGLRLRHAGRNVVVHPSVVIGVRATIFHGVTIGIRRADGIDVPVLGDDVKLSAGCVVIGKVKIGDGVVVGANVVVVRDVPAGCAVIPAPPRIIPPR